MKRYRSDARSFLFTNLFSGFSVYFTFFVVIAFYPQSLARVARQEQSDQQESKNLALNLFKCQLGIISRHVENYLVTCWNFYRVFDFN